MSMNGNDYLFEVFDMFSKMYVSMPCKRTISGKESSNLLFGEVWVHFGLPRGMILDRDTRFLSALWTTLWENMDTMLKISITFHP